MKKPISVRMDAELLEKLREMKNYSAFIERAIRNEFKRINYASLSNN